MSQEPTPQEFEEYQAPGDEELLSGDDLQHELDKRLGSKHLLLQTGFAVLICASLSLLGFALLHKNLAEELFFGVPLLTGFSIPFLARGFQTIAITALTALFVCCSVLVLTGLEGIVCVALSFPFVFTAMGLGALIGALVARQVIKHYGRPHVLPMLACVVAGLSLLGWRAEPDEARPLTVQTRMDFHAPMSSVWQVIRAAGPIEGDPSWLHRVGLPVPEHCEIQGKQRVCYFDQGEIHQRITEDVYGRSLQMRITDCTFTGRDWLRFETAGYELIQHADHVEVVRTDVITSTLSPRWYWAWFEEQCVQVEHEYVLESMRLQAEQGLQAPVSDPPAR